MSRKRGVLGQTVQDESVRDRGARERLLGDVADLYYIQRLSQKAIASRIGRSVPTVSRLLAEAEATGLVDVRVRYPVPIVPSLQRELVNRFGLRLARVADVARDRPCNPLGQVAELAARHLATLLTDGAVVSVAWGSSVCEVARLLKANPHRDVHIVQALGSLGSRLPAIDNPGITQVLAERVDGVPHFLPAPMIVESKPVRDALASDPQFAETLALGNRPDIALVGIGMADPGLAGICRAGYLDPWTMERIRAGGAVGDVVVEFYDLFGHIQETDVGERVLGMRQQELGNSRTVVAVARGSAKAPAILGALRTGLIHVLVTDSTTACRVLELADVYPDHRSVALDGVPAPAVEVSAADAEHHQTTAILDATIAALKASGYDGLTIAAIASRAGVSGQAICERWTSKAALVKEAYIAAADDRSRPVDLGCVQADLQAILTLAADCADRDPTFQSTLRHALTAAIERGKRRGQLNAAADVSVLAELICGAVWYRTQVERTPIDAAFMRGVITTITDGNAPASSEPTGRESGADPAQAGGRASRAPLPRTRVRVVR